MKCVYTRNCVHCGNEFAKASTVSMKTWALAQKCCSSLCANTYRRGKQVSWNKGTKGICKAWNKGLKSPETSGPNNHAWTGTDDKYWKEQCKLRDNFTCVVCNFREDEIMQVDHVKPKSKFPELRYSLDNLQTLCPNCHARKTLKELKGIT